MSFLKYIFLFISFTTFCFSNTYSQNNKSDSITIKLRDSAIFYNEKGINYGREGKLDSAKICITKSLNFKKQYLKPYDTKLANSYINNGIINKLQGNYSAAIKNYNNAEKIFEYNNNTRGQAYSYINKANIYKIFGDYEKAKKYFYHAENILLLTEKKYPVQLGSIYNNLGNLYRIIGKDSMSIEYLLKSIDIKKESKSSRINNTYSNLASSYYNINNYSLAKEYHKKAINYSKKNYGEKSIWYADDILNYATFCTKTKQSNPLELYKKALNIYISNYNKINPKVSNCYNSIGNYYKDITNYSEALKYYQKSLISITNNFNNINISENPEINDALSKTHLLRTLNNKANTLHKFSVEADNKIILLQQSLETYNLAQAIIKQLRTSYQNRESKLILTENKYKVLQNAFLVSAELFKYTNDIKYIEQAYIFSESSKASNLLEASKETEAMKYGNIPDSITQLERKLKQNKWIFEELIYEEKQKVNPNSNKLEFWNNKLFSTTENYNKLKIKLETDYPNYHKLKYSNNIVPLKNIQASIGKDEIIVEYMLVENKLFILQISSDNCKINEQEIDSSFYSNFNIVYNNIKKINFSKHNFESFNNFKNASENLYSVLIHPIAKDITNKKLIIIPDGILAYLPFDVLLYEKTNYKKINYRNLPYFLYKHPISYSYSSSLYANNLKNRKKASKKLAVFAPEYNSAITKEQINKTRQKYREQLLPLEGILEEAKAISQITGGYTFLNKNASESTFKNISDKYDILHFAMHSVINDENPMYSKMIFSMEENSENDGFLNTFEIYNLQLNCRMAVLSSCNSGSGKLRNGEGVMSLARAFMYAGCPSIVMTLWTVNDNSGEKLMTRFYYYLKKHKSKAESLQKAKIDILHNSDQLHSHPYFWANYIVIGNKKPVFVNYYKYLAGFFGLISILAIIIIRKKNRK